MAEKGNREKKTAVQQSPTSLLLCLHDQSAKLNIVEMVRKGIEKMRTGNVATQLDEPATPIHVSVYAK